MHFSFNSKCNVQNESVVVVVANDSSLPFNKNEYTIDTSGDFPKLLYQGVAIYVDKWTGLFRVLNHPELDPYINNVNYLHKFTKKVKKLAEITTKNISFVEEW